VSGWWLTGLDIEESGTHSGADTWQNQRRCECLNASAIIVIIINIITITIRLS